MTVDSLAYPLQFRIAFGGKRAHCSELDLLGGDLSAQAGRNLDHAAPLRIDLREATLLQALPRRDLGGGQVVLRHDELVLEK